MKKIHWSDPDGKQRVWESAERTTRGPSGIDGTSVSDVVCSKCVSTPYVVAVAVLAILRSESNAFPPSTVIIEQYRPPVDAFVVGKSSVHESFGLTWR